MAFEGGRGRPGGGVAVAAWAAPGRVGLGLAGAFLALSLSTGCVTVAEYRKLEERVIDLERQQGGGTLRRQVADYSVEIDALHDDIRTLEGRVEVAERAAAEAQTEAAKARGATARLSATGAGGTTPAGDEAGGGSEPVGAESPDGTGAGVEGDPPRADTSDEVKAYRGAYAAWRTNDSTACIDRFRKFLQTYPASPYADDAAFWMADCHFKQGDYKNAVLRFDDVVRNYPSGNKAPDALYRQGESLLKLGPGFQEAAKRAFERVIKEYPDSALAPKAERQLEMIATG
ncbi:MAG: tol-pal system protein YbgF [Deltaproteobacteria bacterium]|nr:tol-pal system protein YbgF [Deltaproteobacteria bacterium]MBW2419730.1 tol-pal system protein YbgF [Deltaproteobacteria bacterium]